MYRAILAGVALAGLAACPALADDQMAAPSGSGIKMADHATVKLHVVKVNSADMMSSKLIGMTVYNNQNDSVGEVKDLVLENGKTVAGVVVSVGGFLGLGESYVLIDPSSIVVSDKDGTMKAYVDTTKDTLKNEPKFTYNKKS